MGKRTVAQPEAVEVLTAKLPARADDTLGPYRMVRAANRAHRKYQEVSAPDFRGFYHGLLTGYAVAVKALQGKVTAPGRR